jgi:hypothetical protein
MLDVIGLRYHPATAPAPVLADLSLQLTVGSPALVAGRQFYFLESSRKSSPAVTV